MIPALDGAIPRGGKLLAHLEAAQLTPADIDIVFTTHAHGDHIAGNTNDLGDAVFTNARYLIGRTEWNYWTNEETLNNIGNRAHAIRQHLLKIKVRYELVENDEEIIAGVQAIATPGPTPGQLGLRIHSNGQTLLHIADAWHQGIHVEQPDWSPQFDMNPKISPQTRRAIMQMAANENAIVFGYHLPTRGTIRTDSEGWSWQPIH